MKLFFLARMGTIVRIRTDVGFFLRGVVVSVGDDNVILKELRPLEKESKDSKDTIHRVSFDCIKIVSEVTNNEA